MRKVIYWIPDIIVTSMTIGSALFAIYFWFKGQGATGWDKFDASGFNTAMFCFIINGVILLSFWLLDPRRNQ